MSLKLKLQTIQVTLDCPGYLYDSKREKLDFCKEKELEDMNKSQTQVTAEIMASIANSINPSIQVTLDYPENHPDGRMPVLDLKIWVNKEGRYPRVSHTFYKKPIASPYTILKRSAVSESVKRSTIFQETLRRLQHISEDCPWSETVRHLSDFSNCLRISGYDNKTRFQTIRGAIMRHNEMRKKVEMGEIVSVNRTKDEIIRTKREKGGLTASSWYLKGETDKVITCQPTPGGILKSKLNKVMNPPGAERRILITEDGGQPAVSYLKKTDPFFTQTCRYGDENCIVEQTKDCGTMGIIYELTCNTCTEPIAGLDVCKESRTPGGQTRPNYVGMTSTSAHCRMSGHLTGQRSKSTNNPLWRHDRDCHGGDSQKYTMRILSREKSLLPLSILESLYIEKQVKGTSINERNEGGRGGLVRMVAVRGQG